LRLAALVDFKVTDLEVNVQKELIVIVVVGESELDEKDE
jgi:hypothetical protein